MYQRLLCPLDVHVWLSLPRQIRPSAILCFKRDPAIVKELTQAPSSDRMASGRRASVNLRLRTLPASFPHIGLLPLLVLVTPTNRARL